MKRRMPVSAVLRHVNELRAQIGKSPLKRLPKGRRGDYADCVLARAIGATCGLAAAHVPTGEAFGAVHSILLVPPLKQFVMAFDSGAYPELELAR